jgi:predicted TIM-barrel fold metal-dependent hydrolase
MDASTVVDADGHVVEDVDAFARFGWSGRSTGDQTLDMLLYRPSELRRAGLCPDATPWDPEGRLRDMDREGIAISVNYPTALLLVNQVDPAVATELCRVYNDWAYETFTVPTSHRVRTMALVSLGDADEAVRETKRAVTELAVPGIAVSPYVGHRHLDDPALEPLWSQVEELDVAVGIHGGRSTTAPLLPDSSFRDQKRYYAMAHPFGQMVAMGDLALGGVFERHPRLRVAFLESGIGWVRWYADRLDEAWESVENRDAVVTTPPRAPSEYIFGGNCYFSCEPDEPNLPQVVEGVGADLVLFASDYPHFDCKFPHSVDAIRRAGLRDEVLAAVTTDNALRLYGAS